MRRRRQDEGEDYVCPMDLETPQRSGFERGQLRVDEDDLAQVRTNLPFLFTTWTDPFAPVDRWKTQR